MKSSLPSITTPNILEIAYLLDRSHRIVAVNTQAGWPYGIEELAVTLEGKDIDLDHHNFMSHGESATKCLMSISRVFAEVMIVIDKQADTFAGGML